MSKTYNVGKYVDFPNRLVQILSKKIWTLCPKSKLDLDYSWTSKNLDSIYTSTPDRSRPLPDRARPPSRPLLSVPRVRRRPSPIPTGCDRLWHRPDIGANIWGGPSQRLDSAALLGLLSSMAAGASDYHPGYMSRQIWKFRTDKFDTWNKRKFWFMQFM